MSRAKHIYVLQETCSFHLPHDYVWYGQRSDHTKVETWRFQRFNESLRVERCIVARRFGKTNRIQETFFFLNRKKKVILHARTPQMLRNADIIYCCHYTVFVVLSIYRRKTRSGKKWKHSADCVPVVSSLLCCTGRPLPFRRCPPWCFVKRLEHPSELRTYCLKWSDRSFFPQVPSDICFRSSTSPDLSRFSYLLEEYKLLQKTPYVL